jgi:hypothetical protein
MMNESLMVLELAQAYAPFSPFAWPVAWAVGIYLIVCGGVLCILIISIKELILKLLDKLLANGIFGRRKEEK